MFWHLFKIDNNQIQNRDIQRIKILKNRKIEKVKRQNNKTKTRENTKKIFKELLRYRMTHY